MIRTEWLDDSWQLRLNMTLKIFELGGILGRLAPFVVFGLVARGRARPGLLVLDHTSKVRYSLFMYMFQLSCSVIYFFVVSFTLLRDGAGGNLVGVSGRMIYDPMPHISEYIEPTYFVDGDQPQLKSLALVDDNGLVNPTNYYYEMESLGGGTTTTFGVDGLSLCLILLTAFIVPLGILYGWKNVNTSFCDGQSAKIKSRVSSTVAFTSFFTLSELQLEPYLGLDIDQTGSNTFVDGGIVGSFAASVRFLLSLAARRASEVSLESYVVLSHTRSPEVLCPIFSFEFLLELIGREHLVTISFTGVDDGFGHYKVYRETVFGALYRSWYELGSEVEYVLDESNEGLDIEVVDSLQKFSGTTNPDKALQSLNRIRGAAQNLASGVVAVRAGLRGKLPVPDVTAARANKGGARPPKNINSRDKRDFQRVRELARYIERHGNLKDLQQQHLLKKKIYLTFGENYDSVRQLDSKGLLSPMHNFFSRTRETLKSRVLFGPKDDRVERISRAFAQMEIFRRYGIFGIHLRTGKAGWPDMVFIPVDPETGTLISSVTEAEKRGLPRPGLLAEFKQFLRNPSKARLLSCLIGNPNVDLALFFTPDPIGMAEDLNAMIDQLEFVDEDTPVNLVFTNRDGSILGNYEKDKPVLPDGLKVRDAKKILRDKHQWGRLCLINRPPVKRGKFSSTIEQMDSIVNNTREDVLKSVEKNPYYARDQYGRQILTDTSPGGKVVTNMDQIFRPPAKHRVKSSLSKFKSITRDKKDGL